MSETKKHPSSPEEEGPKEEVSSIIEEPTGDPTPAREESYWDALTEDMDKEAEIALSDLSRDLLQMATTKDELTGLHSLQSKYLLNTEVRQRIKQSFRAESRPMFLYLDLDGFKAVNDTISHDAGDVVLIEFGKAMQDVLREEDMIFREGGDEFGALLFNVSSPMVVEGITKNISSKFKERLRALDGKATLRGDKEIDFPGDRIADMVAFSAAAVEVETEDLQDAKAGADQLLKHAKADPRRDYSSKFGKYYYRFTDFARGLIGLPPAVLEGKNCLVIEGLKSRHRIEENPNLKFHLR